MPKKSFTVIRPPISQPRRLLKYSNEHVAYEVSMFFNSIDARKVQMQASSQAIGHFFNMARIEVFVLHFRNLIGFLYPDRYRPQPDDVLAHHFLSGPAPLSAWIKARPQLSRTLKRAKDRADKEVAHLTTGRIAGARPQKGWDFVALGDEIRNCLNILIQVADPNRLGHKVKAAVPVGPL